MAKKKSRKKDSTVFANLIWTGFLSLGFLILLFVVMIDAKNKKPTFKDQKALIKLETKEESEARQNPQANPPTRKLKENDLSRDPILPYLKEKAESFLQRPADQHLLGLAPDSGEFLRPLEGHYLGFLDTLGKSGEDLAILYELNLKNDQESKLAYRYEAMLTSDSRGQLAKWEGESLPGPFLHDPKSKDIFLLFNEAYLLQFFLPGVSQKLYGILYQRSESGQWQIFAYIPFIKKDPPILPSAEIEQAPALTAPVSEFGTEEKLSPESSNSP